MPLKFRKANDTVNERSSVRFQARLGAAPLLSSLSHVIYQQKKSLARCGDDVESLAMFVQHLVREVQDCLQVLLADEDIWAAYPGFADHHSQPQANHPAHRNAEETQQDTDRHQNPKHKNERRQKTEHNSNRITFSGAAGQPRGLAPSGDQRPQPPYLKRNTDRGLRSTEAINRRRHQRTDKRRWARDNYRKTGRVEKNKEEQDKDETQAKAQEPKNKWIKLGTTIMMATLNMRGAKKIGAREEVEIWMKERGIQILGLQETRIANNTRESRKEYTWFLSGEGGRETYTAGVGIVIANNMLQYIEDIEPINDRRMYIVLKGTLQTTFITAYFPQSDRPTEETEHIYEKLQNIIDKRNNKGPIYIGADWNARLIYPRTENEEQIMGKHTLHNNGYKIETFTEAMKEHRDLMIEFCMTNDMRVVNTMYKKRPETKTATYRKVEIDIAHEIDKDTHEQIDYIVTPKRWRNAITNAESDTKANIDSDHYPVIAQATLRSD